MSFEPLRRVNMDSIKYYTTMRVFFNVDEWKFFWARTLSVYIFFQGKPINFHSKKNIYSDIKCVHQFRHIFFTHCILFTLTRSSHTSQLKHTHTLTDCLLARPHQHIHNHPSIKHYNLTSNKNETLSADETRAIFYFAVNWIATTSPQRINERILIGSDKKLSFYDYCSLEKWKRKFLWKIFREIFQTSL